MIEIKNRLKKATDKTTWAARGATFITKAKATKTVWFPPKPDQVGEQTAAKATQATKNTAARSTAAANKATG